MKTRTYLIVGVDETMMSRLQEILPEGRTDETTFKCQLDADDPRLNMLLERLNSNGIKPWDHSGPSEYMEHYNLKLYRQHDASDWERAEYLEPFEPDMERELEVWRDPQGRLGVGGKDLVPGRPFYMTMRSAFVCSDPARRVLEAAGLGGLAFRDVEVDPAKGNFFSLYHPPPTLPIEGMPLWQVTPTVKLPPLSPTMTLTDPQGNPQPPGLEEAWYQAREGHYFHAELRLRREDLASIEPFDVAHTRERFKMTGRTVVSNRFYRVCVENGLEMTWVPVHIEN